MFNITMITKSFTIIENEFKRPELDFAEVTLIARVVIEADWLELLSLELVLETPDPVSLYEVTLISRVVAEADWLELLSLELVLETPDPVSLYEASVLIVPDLHTTVPLETVVKFEHKPRDVGTTVPPLTENVSCPDCNADANFVFAESTVKRPEKSVTFE